MTQAVQIYQQPANVVPLHKTEAVVFMQRHGL